MAQKKINKKPIDIVGLSRESRLWLGTLVAFAFMITDEKIQDRFHNFLNKTKCYLDNRFKSRKKN